MSEELTPRALKLQAESRRLTRALEATRLELVLELQSIAVARGRGGV